MITNLFVSLLHTHLHNLACLPQLKKQRNSMTQPTLFTFIFFVTNLLVSGKHIPTTLQGPFHPITIHFDPSLRRGSDDIPMDDPRLKKNVTSMFPEQIALALSTPTSMWVSWVTGDAQIGPNVTALDPTSVASEVWYGKESGNYSSKKRGNATVYSQLYPFEGLFNYTSATIHRVRIDDILNYRPGTRDKNYYRCGDSSLPAMSEEHVFETLPIPAQNSYPRRIAVIGDLGLTRNSSTTIDHLSQNDPSLILMVGDLTYANQYLTTGGKVFHAFHVHGATGLKSSYDGHRGNHEIEPQAAGITFKSYLTRFAVPAKRVHFIMLGAYVDYNSGERTICFFFMFGAQYAWLREDLRKVDRTVTPWLVAAWHPPWYNSYSSHYQEFECMRQEMEQLLYHYGVDIVFSGHVRWIFIHCIFENALNRHNKTCYPCIDPYDLFDLGCCGPIYITVGDGGNIEKVDVDHADEPGKCPSQGDNMPEIGGVCHLNFSSGPAKGNFCWDRQPEWSAYRESSFGHGILEVLNSTYALWSWHRNQDTYKEDSPGDQIYIVRQPDICSPSTSLKGNNESEQVKGAAVSAKCSCVLLLFMVAFVIYQPLLCD
ncbi:hypothetical protein CXB51_025900 [Gossypium anomalum]|uniref:Purple acid phosphatase n=1 Tax=Gossypium anomalum TaxID=47600 RepID=A0A8J5YDD6_9ROSI|nr:hypothetical protein CXB51_025900 [Gossypium anomalum]